MTFGRRDIYVRAVLLGLVTVLTFLRIRDVGFVGHDTYPIILTSRILSWGDFVGTFTESLMDGRYPGLFHRPLLSLTVAFDYAAWGLDPRGYQWTSALFFALCLAAVHRLAHRLGPGSPHWVVPFVMLLHPSVAEVLPAPARRAETLCCAFLALAAGAALSTPSRRGRNGLRVAAFTALAIGAKETGFLAPFLVGAARFVGAIDRDRRSRATEALLAAAPSAAMAVFLLGCRWVVLGGVGGHDESDVGASPGRVLGVLGVLGEQLVLPMRHVHSGWVMALLAVVFLALTLQSRSVAVTNRGGLRLVAVGTTWLALASLAYAGAGRLSPWYLLIPIAAWSMILAGVAAELVARTGAGSRSARSVAAVGLLALSLLVAFPSGHALLLRDYPQLQEGTVALDRFLEPLKSRLEKAEDGDVIDVGPPPKRIRRSGEGSELRGVWLLDEYSVQAWAELVLPERDIRVETWKQRPPGRPDDPALQPGPDEVLVVVRPDPRQVERGGP